ATIIWNLLKSRGIESSHDAERLHVLDTDKWAEQAVKNIIGLGLRSEKDKSVPYGSREVMTRGEAAALVSLSLNHLRVNENSVQEIEYYGNVVQLDSSIY